MKRKLSIFIICYISFSAFSQHKFVHFDSIDSNLKEKSFQFVSNMLESCRLDAMPRIKIADYTKSFQKNYMSKALLKKCNRLQDNFGQLKNVELKQVIVDSNNLKHLRYKLTYQVDDKIQSLRNLDARVIFSSKNKFHWFHYFEYWENNFKPIKPLVFNEVPLSGIDSTILKNHLVFAKSNYQLNNEGYKKFINLKDLARPNKIEKWNKGVVVEKDSIFKKNGSFKEFYLAQKVKTNFGYDSYRYKVQFNKLRNPSEVRLYVDKEERYIGTLVLDVWYDKYIYYDDELKKRIEKEIKYL